MQSQKIWKHDVTGFKFRSHGAKGRQIPRGEVSSTIYVLYDFFTQKSETNILLEDFTNCHVLLLIHLMKITWTGGEKIPDILRSYLTVLNDGLHASVAISHDFSNLENLSTSILLMLPLSYGNPSFVKFRKNLGFRSYLSSFVLYNLTRPRPRSSSWSTKSTCWYGEKSSYDESDQFHRIVS